MALISEAHVGWPSLCSVNVGGGGCGNGLRYVALMSAVVAHVAWPSLMSAAAHVVYGTAASADTIAPHSEFWRRTGQTPTTALTFKP